MGVCGSKILLKFLAGICKVAVSRKKRKESHLLNSCLVHLDSRESGKSLY